MLAYHTLPADRVLSELASSELGLSPEEAEARLKKYGPNALRKKKKAGALRLFLAQFKDFMTIRRSAAPSVPDIPRSKRSVFEICSARRRSPV